MLTDLGPCRISQNLRIYRDDIINRAASYEAARLILPTMSGPDGIRTRALGLDRAACSATTPRDHATGSLLYILTIVKPGGRLEYSQAIDH
jgi:hypothetical protein